MLPSSHSSGWKANDRIAAGGSSHSVACLVGLEKEDAVGAWAAQSSRAANAEPAEREPVDRAAHRSEMQSLVRPLLIAKIISGASVILGFGGFFCFD